MSIGREAIYAALEATMAAALTGTFPVVSRNVRHFASVSHGEMPALFFLQKKENIVRKRGIPKKNLLTLDLVIYTPKSNDPATPTSTAINNALDAVDNALQPNPITNNVDLGLPGVVEHCWIEGTADTYEAILVETSIIIVPIHILTTG